MIERTVVALTEMKQANANERAMQCCTAAAMRQTAATMCQTAAAMRQTQAADCSQGATAKGATAPHRQPNSRLSTNPDRRLFSFLLTFNTTPGAHASGALHMYEVMNAF